MTKELSIIIPLYKMPESVILIEKKVLPVAKSTGLSFELLLIDDGSGDKTWEKIEELSIRSEFIKGIKLSRNFGQQIAVSAGIAKARGKYVIVMDGDMQNPPEALPKIILEQKLLKI